MGAVLSGLAIGREETDSVELPTTVFLVTSTFADSYTSIPRRRILLASRGHSCYDIPRDESVVADLVDDPGAEVVLDAFP